MTDIMAIYPFNLAKSILGDETEALKVYISGIPLALATLSEREREVIRLRFQKKMTLEQCGKEHGITRERIRQIEAKAIRKLRHPSRANMIKAVPLAEVQQQHSEYLKLSQAYELLSKAFEVCTAKRADPGVVVPTAELPVHLQTPISELDLSRRSYNCLRGAGKDTLRDITEMTRDELAKIRNMGRKSVEEVVRKIEIYGLILKEGQDES